MAVLKKHTVSILCCITLYCVLFTQSCLAANDTTTVRKLVDSVARTGEANPRKALALADSAVQLAERLNYKSGMIYSLNAKGIVSMLLGNTKDAMDCFSRTLSISTETHDLNAQGSAFINMATLYMRLGTYNKAFELYTKGLEIKKAIHDTLGIAGVYENIGTCLDNMHEPAEASKNYFRALDLFKTLNRPDLVAGEYVTLANSYIVRKDYATAIKYLDESVSINRGTDTAALFAAYVNLGICYENSGQKDKALEYYRKCLPYFTRVGDIANAIEVLCDMGATLIELGKYKEAEQVLTQGMQLAGSVGDKKALAEIDHNLSELYAKQRDYANAYKYQGLSIAMHDSLLNEEKINDLARQDAKFEIGEAEEKNKLLQNEIDLKNKEVDLQRLRLQRKDIILYSGAALTIALVALGILLIRNNRLRANKQRVELEQKQLQAQMNPHFIFNCLNSIQRFIVQKDAVRANKYLADFALLMRQTLDNSKTSELQLQKEIDYLENYLSLENMRFANKFSYEVKCAADVDANTAEIPSMIIQPFVENALLHGLLNLQDREGKLTVSFYHKGEHLFCEIDDNGVGIQKSEALKEQMFLKHQPHGMALTRQRLALLGKINSADYQLSIVNKMNGDQPAGTTIIIKFPYNT